MDIKIIYPSAKKHRDVKKALTLCCKWTFLLAGLICAAVNICVGDRAWSVVALWSMWLVWAQLVSPDMVEYNRISQTIKLIVNVCILLFLIDWLLTPGWAMGVVPIVSFSALILVSILFFADIETQQHNMFPLLFFGAVCLVGSIIGMSVWRTPDSWIFAATGSVAVCLLIGCRARLGKELLRELQKRFSVK